MRENVAVTIPLGTTSQMLEDIGSTLARANSDLQQNYPGRRVEVSVINSKRKLVVSVTAHTLEEISHLKDEAVKVITDIFKKNRLSGEVEKHSRGELTRRIIELFTARKGEHLTASDVATLLECKVDPVRVAMNRLVVPGVLARELRPRVIMPRRGTAVSYAYHLNDKKEETVN